MRRIKFFSFDLKRYTTFFMILCFVFSVIMSCSTQKPLVHASKYKYIYNGEKYQIWSIFDVENDLKQNRLISEEFNATDIDQDGIIDIITSGYISLENAQKIYSAGIDMATMEQKVSHRIPEISTYLHENTIYTYEIKSFRPIQSQPFNEFKVTDKRPILIPEVFILIDQQADGVLDDVVKGRITPDKFQAKYTDAINEGLEKQKLTKVDDMILVINND